MSPEVVAQLRAQQIANVVEARQNATEVSYPGGDGVVVSEGNGQSHNPLAHLCPIASFPALAAAVVDYQKCRVKKLKKQMGGQSG